MVKGVKLGQRRIGHNWPRMVLYEGGPRNYYISQEENPVKRTHMSWKAASYKHG